MVGNLLIHAFTLIAYMASFAVVYRMDNIIQRAGILGLFSHVGEKSWHFPLTLIRIIRHQKYCACIVGYKDICIKTFRGASQLGQGIYREREKTLYVNFWRLTMFYFRHCQCHSLKPVTWNRWIALMWLSVTTWINFDDNGAALMYMARWAKLKWIWHICWCLLRNITLVLYAISCYMKLSYNDIRL